MWFANFSRFCSALFLSILAGVGIAGCSVSSLSDLENKTSAHFERVVLPEVNNRAQQIFNRTIEERIGSGSGLADYRLSYALTSATRSVLSSAGEESSLNNTKMAVSYQLYDMKTDKLLTSGTIDAFATSGAISSYYGQDVSAEFAEARLVKLLAERLYQKLQLYFISLEA